jgi:hypothetical protein
VATLGDYIRHLQEVDKQSNQPCVACEPVESSFDHICPNNPILTCNCTDPNACAELGGDPDGNGTSGDSANNAGNEDRCPNHDGFADNIEYTGIPIPSTKGKSKVRGWPCVVVGAVCEAWDNSAERVSGSEHSAGHTEQHIDARQKLDGSVATTKL